MKKDRCAVCLDPVHLRGYCRRHGDFARKVGELKPLTDEEFLARRKNEKDLLSKNHDCRANPKILHRHWHQDPLMAEEVYRNIRLYESWGLTDSEIAERIGISSRTVVRYRARRRQQNAEGTRTE